MLSTEERRRLHELEAKPARKRSQAEDNELLDLRRRDLDHRMGFIGRDTSMPEDDGSFTHRDQSIGRDPGMPGDEGFSRSGGDRK